MNRTAVLNVVGLTESLLGDRTPRITAFRKRGAVVNIDPAFPALTTTAQSNYVTGTKPAQHGIVANGWYDRELAEVQFWKPRPRAQALGRAARTRPHVHLREAFLVV